MDSPIGLDYIVENRDYVEKLGTALDTNNVTVKKQIFELFSALCTHNADGYSRAIEALEFYQNLKRERYRFGLVLHELEKETDVEYQVALLRFINCVINSTPNLQDRNRMRNEFIGLKLLPLLSDIRKVSQSVTDIIVQLDLFDHHRGCDETQTLQDPNGINLNSPLDVFYAILRQVADTPQEVHFLSILQHLLRIDPKDAISDVVWHTTEKLVHRATLLESHDDSVRLQRTTSVQMFTPCTHCRIDGSSPTRKPTSPRGPHTAATNTPNNNNNNSSTTNNNTNGSTANPSNSQTMIGGATTATPRTTTTIITITGTQELKPTPPPPPPPPPSCTPIPPPPPPQPFGNTSASPLPPPLPPGGLGGGVAGPPPPPLPLHADAHRNASRSPLVPPHESTVVLLPQQDTPTPKTKMKTINWGKIPQNKVIGTNSIWAIVADSHQNSPMQGIDWSEMEDLFRQQSTSNQGSPKLGRDAGNADAPDSKVRKETSEITLLDGKRSLNVNIFLKQFRTSNEDIMQLIRSGNHQSIGSEKLRGLLKILPEVDEVDILRSFSGDRNRLGNAEKFLIQLIEIPNYKLRIESMLLKEEFAANITYLDPCINDLIYAGEDLINNTMIREVLYVVVVAGNFLNSGGYAGNAAGVKLASLQKLTDIRANKPGMNLIHYVAMQVEKRNPELLGFASQMTSLENAARTTTDQISNEIQTLKRRIEKIKKQVQLQTTDDDIKEQMASFLESAEQEVSVLQNGIEAVEQMRLKLANFFCEDPATFKLEECYKIFQIFCDKFKQAVSENEKRQRLEHQATLRRQQRELNKKAKQEAETNGFDPRASPAFQRRQFNSFNCGTDIATHYQDNDITPDITPTGSLRRRRSRVVNAEDELLHFLVNAREDRKTYGSLDRKRIRRRPDTISADFGVDRERPSSPNPSITHDRPSPVGSSSSNHLLGQTEPPPPPPKATEDLKPRISSECRKKIENWLQSNDADDKQKEEYKRKRRLFNSNRRSFENDTVEGERKLDTLLEEEKIMSPVPTVKLTNCNGKYGNIENYTRVYQDWKPAKSLESSDIVGTIQAIADDNAEREKALHRKLVHRQLSMKSLLSRNASEPSAAKDFGEDARSQRVARVLSEQGLVGGADECRPPRSGHQRRPEHSSESDVSARLQRTDDRGNHRIAASPPAQPQPNEESGEKQDADERLRNPRELTKNASYTKVVAGCRENGPRTASPSAAAEASACPPESAAAGREEASPKDDTFASLLDHHRNYNENYGHQQDGVTEDKTRRSPRGGSAESKEVAQAADGGEGGEGGGFSNSNTFDRHSLVRRTTRRPKNRSSEHVGGAGSQDEAGVSLSLEALTLNTATTTAKSATTTSKPTTTSSLMSSIDTAATTTTLTSPSTLPITVTNITSDLKANITSNSKANITSDSKANITSNSKTNITSDSKANINLNSNSKSNITSNLNSKNVPAPLKCINNNNRSLPNNNKIMGSNHQPNHHHNNNNHNKIITNNTPQDPNSNPSPPPPQQQPLQHRLTDDGGIRGGAAGGSSVAAAAAVGSSKVRVEKFSQPLAINQEDVRNAIAKLKSPTVAPEGGWFPPPRAAAPPPSQADTQRILKLNASLKHQQQQHRSPGPRSGRPPMAPSPGPGRQPPPSRTHESLGPLRPSPQTSPLHQPASPSKRSDAVERSASRNSLRSSRSSINSAGSSHTVRRMPVSITTVKTPLPQTALAVAVQPAAAKRPLLSQNLVNGARQLSYSPLRAGTMVAAASRSSSSGSSIGHKLTAPSGGGGGGGRSTSSTRQNSSLAASTSFKENHHAAVPVKPRKAIVVKTSHSARGVIDGSAGRPPPSDMMPQRSLSSPRHGAGNAARLSSFMRPTASSSTKRSK